MGEQSVYKMLDGANLSFLILHADKILLIGYTDFDFQVIRDERKSTSGYAFTLS